MEEAKLTSKGQITIPKEIRKHLGLKEGGKIMFIERTDEVVIRPKIKDPILKLREMRKKIKISEKEIDKMIKESKRDWR